MSAANAIASASSIEALLGGRKILQVKRRTALDWVLIIRRGISATAVDSLARTLRVTQSSAVDTKLRTFLLDRRKLQPSVDSVKPLFNSVNAAMYDCVIQMKLSHLRFNRRYSLFDRAEVVFDQADIAPYRPQMFKDQVLNILTHGFDSSLHYDEDFSVFCESKAKVRRQTTKRRASLVISS